MTAFQLTVLAAALAVASTTAGAQSPEERSTALAKATADQGTTAKARTASTQGTAAAEAALRKVLSSALKEAR